MRPVDPHVPPSSSDQLLTDLERDLQGQRQWLATGDGKDVAIFIVRLDRHIDAIQHEIDRRSRSRQAIGGAA